ncbi:hypothetical protein FGO68_gene5673 [Halteria grandinella]|uniref:Uncharacterized protein n=1 Tax=Halteria grandinella TaxID=5974 RepID=A0A8J8N8Y3_HALGN|nr:hypothetical protein FGO68_gene5673 [Halteria grandinella]
MLFGSVDKYVMNVSKTCFFPLSLLLLSSAVLSFFLSSLNIMTFGFIEIWFPLTVPAPLKVPESVQLKFLPLSLLYEGIIVKSCIRVPQMFCKRGKSLSKFLDCSQSCECCFGLF